MILRFERTKKSLVGIFGLLVIMLSSCSTLDDPYTKKTMNWLQQSEPIRVLCTTEMIEALVQEIGGEHIQTLALVYGELDPHSYQMVKGDNEKMAKASIVFGNGLGLEHGPSLKLALDHHPQVSLLGDQLYQKNPNLFIHHEDVVDPHVWLDVGLFAKLCPLAAQTLAEYDPAHSAIYQQRAKDLQERLQVLDAQIQDKFNAIAADKRFLVTSHQAFYYMARAYLALDHERLNQSWKERFCAPEGLAPESQISLNRIHQVVNYIKKYKVKAAFLEMNVSSDAIFKIKDVLKANDYPLEVPLSPLYSDSMPEIDPKIKLDPDASACGCSKHTKTALERYLMMIEHNSQLILDTWNQ